MTRATDVLARLALMRSGDVPVHGGRTLAYVYDSGLAEVDQVGRDAVAAYAGSNGLDPTAFPSLLQMENDLVAFAARLLDAPDTVVGSVTSGGTESVLLAVQGASSKVHAKPTSSFSMVSSDGNAVGSSPLEPAYAATAARPTSSTSARPES